MKKRKDGRYQMNVYVGLDKDGKKVYTTDVVANQVEFLGGAQAHSDASGTEGQAVASGAGVDDYPDDGFFAPSDEDDDIPF